MVFLMLLDDLLLRSRLSFKLQMAEQTTLFHYIGSHLASLNSSALIAISILTFTTAALIIVLVTIVAIRQRTRNLLTKAGFPTVFWRPKFVNYQPNHAAHLISNDNIGSCCNKLPASSITRILPRMERLQGPYGMYGTVYGLSTAVIHVAHPVPAAALLHPTKKNTKLFESTGATKSPAYDHFHNFCGQGVFTADGQDWKEKRAAVIHALLRAAPGGYQDAVEKQAHIAADELVQRLGTRRSGSVNIVPVLQRATIGLIYRYITHCNLEQDENDGEDDDDDTLATSSHLSTTSSTSASDNVDRPSKTLLRDYLDSITKIRMIILAQSRSLWFVLPQWCYRTFSSLFQQEEESLQPIREFARKACHNAIPGSPLTTLQSHHLYASADTNGGVSKNLLDEAITLLFAGQDTSAATLSWTLHLLSIYPDIQRKLAEEVQQSVLDPNNLSRAQFAKLPYLDAVLKESMRLYPVAPFVVRRVTAPTVIHGERSVVVPEGTIACIWIYSLHRNPAFWKDPDAFRPERWMDETDSINPGAYMPFAAGPRNCVGQPLAHLILRILLARLIHAFEFVDERLQSGVDPDRLRKDLQVGFTVLPQGGVSLRVLPRK